MNAPIPQGIATAFHMVAVDAITPSNTATQARRRRRFDEAALSALTRDVQDKGVIEPILVIQLDDIIISHGAGNTASVSQYEIVAGERRWLASKAAGLSHIPAMVTNITRDELVAFQVVENKLREAMHPLDEAEALRELMAEGRSAEAAGAKIGLKRSQAYNRLKLLELAPDVLDAMESGRLDASKALCIARVPGHKLQKKALKLALESNWKGQPLSERELSEALNTKFFVRLDAVPFDTADTTLDPARGACTECQHCSLNDPELHAELQGTQGVGAFICMNKPCHDNKVQLHFGRRIDRARASGMRIIEGDEAKTYAHSGEDFTDLDSVCYDLPEEHRQGERYPTYRKLLGKGDPEGLVLILEPGRNEPIEALADADLTRALEAKGIKLELPERDIPFTEEDARTAGAAAKRIEQERAKEEARRTLERAYRARLLKLVHDKFKGPLKKGDLVQLLDIFFDCTDAPIAVYELYGTTEGEQINYSKFSEAELTRLLLELSIGRSVDYVGDAPGPLLDVAARLKIDAPRVRKQVKAEIDGPAEKKPTKAKAGKKAKKK